MADGTIRAVGVACHENAAAPRGAPVFDPPPVPPPLGSYRFDRHRRRLGVGGMGEVWLAWDEARDVDRAVKLPSPRFAMDPYWRLDMKREAHILRHLSHPSIAAFHDFVTEDDRCGLVMEYVDGRTLRRRLDEDGVPPPDEALRIAFQVATALDAAHSHPQRIVHCDLKPANVIVAEDGTVKVLDWGIARSEACELATEPPDDHDGFADAAEAADPLFARSPVRFGTPGYLPPEVLLGDRRATRAVDIFAFGAVLFELLSGERPFPGESAAARIARTCAGPPEFSRIRDGTPPAIWSLLRRLLERDVPLRCADIADAIEVLAPPSNPVVRRTRAPGNLPAMALPFVGRDSLRAALHAAITEDRFICVHGIGGLGKTDLVLQIAHELAAARPEREQTPGQDGVWLVRMEHATDAALLAEIVGSALGDRAGTIEELARLIGLRSIVVVLDRCDEISNEVAEFCAALLRLTPGVRFVATCRMPLRHATSFRVGPLPVPASLHELGTAEIASLDAVRLFVERVRLGTPRFDPGAGELRGIAEIVRMLDGVPRSIEMAASWLGGRSLAELRDELDSVVIRHGEEAVLSMVEWSLARLGPEHRRLLAVLALFPGGCSIDAAAEVASRDAPHRADVAELLGDLIDHALVEVERPEGLVRYRLLVPVRRVVERITDDDGRVVAQNRYRKWCRDLIEGGGPSGETTLERLVVEWPNLAPAIDDACADGRVDDAAAMAIALHRLWYRRGLQGEGLRIVERVIATRERSAPAAPVEAPAWWLTQARLHNAAGLLAWIGFDYDRAEREQREAATILERMGEAGERGLAGLLINRALVAKDRRQSMEAIELLAQAKAIAGAIQDPVRAAQADLNMAVVLQEAGRIDEAMTTIERCLPIMEGDVALREFQAEAHFVRALASIDRRDLAAAGRDLLRSIELDRERGAAARTPDAISKAPQRLWGVARLAERRGDLGAAATLRLGAVRLAGLLRIRIEPLEADHEATMARLRMAIAPGEWESISARSSRVSASELVELAERLASVSTDEPTVDLPMR